MIIQICENYMLKIMWYKYTKQHFALPMSNHKVSNHRAFLFKVFYTVFYASVMIVILSSAGYFKTLQNSPCLREENNSTFHFNGQISQEQTWSTKAYGKLKHNRATLHVQNTYILSLYYWRSYIHDDCTFVTCREVIPVITLFTHAQ